jgi:hypothetical protein
MKKKYILIGVIISFFGCISLIEAASYGTDVEYTGLGEETYYIEVPAKLSPGESGEVKVKIYKTFPLEKADDAQQVLYRGENVGKVVLTVK